jgi:hypothetical protein
MSSKYPGTRWHSKTSTDATFFTGGLVEIESAKSLIAKVNRFYRAELAVGSGDFRTEIWSRDFVGCSH